MSKRSDHKGGAPHGIATVHVLGCKVNQAEAAGMAQVLTDNGYTVDQKAPDADVVVVHTCCVTSRAEAKSRRLVQSLATRFPSARIVVTGCLTKIHPSSLEGPRQVVVQTTDRQGFENIVNMVSSSDHSCESSKDGQFADLGAAPIPGRKRTFLKVQDGCSQGCTYCIVPRARGRSRSLPPNIAIDHAVELEAAGVAEIVLTGTHLGVYGRDLQPQLSLVDVVERLIRACPSVRFRLSSIEPQELTDRLIQLITSHPAVCRHVHVPLQSGDDAILRRMGRPYDSSLVKELIRKLFCHSPDCCVGMDVMVGFPGEDDRAFASTLGLIQELKPAYLHVFPFSPRPGTPAAQFKPKVPANIARARVEELRSLSHALRCSFYERFRGKVLSAVCEKVSASGGRVVVRTDNYIPVEVVIPKTLLDAKFLQVTVDRVQDQQVTGRVIG